MGRFIPSYPLEAVAPADYNPRRLSDEAFETLKSSLRDLGIIRPIILAADNTIIAGHQRTRSMKAIGITHAPAFVIENANKTDEIRFNQIHNASDVEFGTQTLTVPAFDDEQVGSFVHVDPASITGPTKGRGAGKRNELLRLLTRYGEFSSAVATQAGEVIIGKQYAASCAIIGMPLLTYVLPDHLRELALSYFAESYGVFSYDHLPRTTWGQTLAQMHRLRTGRQTANLSTLYEYVVIPRLQREDRILDFGAGQKDYVKMLRRRGHDIIAYEPYFRFENRIDVTQVHRDIDRLCEELRTRGRFDVVICDSVLNSVDSLQAQEDVLVSLAALCRPGGTVYYSGRSLPASNYADDQLLTFTASAKRTTHFFDADGFTAIYSRGVWRYQKMHSYEEVVRMSTDVFGPGFTLFDNDGREIEQKEYEVDPLKYSFTWKVATRKRKDLPQGRSKESLAREFNMPLPGNTSYGRSDDIIEAFRAALRREADNGHDNDPE